MCSGYTSLRMVAQAYSVEYLYILVFVAKIMARCVDVLDDTPA